MSLTLNGFLPFAIAALGCASAQIPEPVPTSVGPIEGEFPRSGLRWSYRCEIRASDGSLDESERTLEIELSALNDGEFFARWRPQPRSDNQHPLGPERLVIDEQGIWLSPPGRLLAKLRWARFNVWPTPRIRPGESASYSENVRGTRRSIFQRSYPIQGETVSVPAGRFTDCLVSDAMLERRPRPQEPALTKWRARYWWVERVGMVRLLWWHPDGRRIDLQLTEVRDTAER